MKRELIDTVYEKFEYRKAKPIGNFKRSSVMILLNKVGTNINIIFEVRALTLKKSTRRCLSARWKNGKGRKTSRSSFKRNCRRT